MPKMTAAERAELEAKLAADDDDDDDEVELGFADGSSFRGKFSRARGVAAARGFKLEADPAKDNDGKDDPPKGEVKRFNAGRRTG